MSVLVLVALTLASPDLVIQQPHPGVIREAAFRPDGKVVATAAFTIKLWDVESGRMLVSVPTGRVNGIAWTPDGKHLVAGLINARVRVWEVATMKLVVSEDVDGGGYCGVAVSPNGKHFAWGGDGFCRVSTLDGKTVHEWHGEDRDRFWAAAFSPDGKHVYGAGDNLYKWRLADGSRRTVERGRTQNVAFAGDALVTERDGELRRGADVLARKATHYAFHGTRVAFVQADGVHVGDAVLKAPTQALAFSPDGKRLLCGNELWDLATKAKIRTFTGSTARAMRCAGTTLAVRRGEFTEVWDFAADRTLGRLPAGSPIVLSPAATHLWCGDRVLDLASGIVTPAPYRGARTVAVANGGKLFAWRLDEETIALSNGRRLPGKKYNDILGLAFSPDGTKVLQGGKGNYRAIVDVATGKHVVKEEKGPGWVMSLALSRDGTKLLCGGPYSSVVLRDAKTLAPIHSMTGHRGAIYGVAFVGSRLVTVGGEGTARVWDAATGKHLLTVHVLDDGAWIAVAPDGRYEASTGASQSAAWREGLTAKPLASIAPTKSLIQGILGR